MIRKCGNCGKTFHSFGPKWGYAVGSTYTCTYKCMRELECKESEKEMTAEQKQTIMEMADKGMSAVQISEKTQLPRKYVYNYIYNHKTAKKEEKPQPAIVKTETPNATTEEKIVPEKTAAEKPVDDYTAVIRLLERIVGIIEKITPRCQP